MKLRTKILITILLAVGWFLLTNYGGCNTQADEYTVTNGHLNNAFREFNEEYFYGGLPSTTVRLADLSDLHSIADIRQMEDERWIIRIDRRSNPTINSADMSLLHEMCHEQDKISGQNEGLDGHSDAFEACMVSLAQRGAFKGKW
jgi:hypothetical protein